MQISRFVFWMFSIGTMVLNAGVVSGQTTSAGSGQPASTGSGQAYPNKPVRMVTSAVGGATDVGARVIGPGISGPLGQQVIVDNRSGGTVPAEVVTKAPADGYTLLFYSSSTWLAPFLRDKVSYDPVQDLSPITLATRAPNILVVHPSVAANSVKELISLAKASPGKLNYASAAVAGASHLGAELFKAMAGVNIVYVPYRGTGPALIDLIAGQVQLTFATAGAATPHVKTGRLRALAITSAQPSALLPGLPTVAASGLTGYEVTSINGLWAPAKTPQAIIKRLNQEVVRLLNTAEAKERFQNAGTEPIGSSPEEFAATIKSEMTRLGKVIKDAGIREE